MPHFTTPADYERLHQVEPYDHLSYNPLLHGSYALDIFINWPPSPPQSRRTSGPATSNISNFGFSNTNSAKTGQLKMLAESDRQQSWTEQVKDFGSIGRPNPSTLTRPAVASGPTPPDLATTLALNSKPTPVLRASASDLRATAPVFVAPSTLINETAVDFEDDLFPDNLMGPSILGGGSRTRTSDPRLPYHPHRYSDVPQSRSSLDLNSDAPFGTFDRPGQVARSFGAIGTPIPAQSRTEVSRMMQRPSGPPFGQAQLKSPQPAKCLDQVETGLEVASSRLSLNGYKHKSPLLHSRGSANIGTHIGRHPVFPRDVYLEAHRLAQGQGPSMRYAEVNKATPNPMQPPPPKTYAVVEFKLYRPEIYEMRTNWGTWEKGDILTVIVEADRGFDLGQVWAMTEEIDEAKKTKKELYLKHWNQLLQYSETDYWAKLPTRNPTESNKLFEEFYAHLMSQPLNTGGTPPKAAVEQASLAALANLPQKQHLEAHAKRVCKEGARICLPSMEVLEVEYQMDHQKLTIYYLSPIYVDYNKLQNDLYKVFKCRLWFVALDPASFHPAASGFSRRSMEMVQSLHHARFPHEGASNHAVDHNMAYQGHGYFSSSPNHSRQQQRVHQEQQQQQRREGMQRQPQQQYQPSAAAPLRHDSGFVGRRSTLPTTRSPWNPDPRAGDARRF